ncbi:magnesium-translocating P-type ATPase [Methanoregula sp.]|uniref:magnesium-translocating P-type ATPase n=1 Tax=Methanoregula sp. TaxID=2052170 RepID=UPI00356530E5
MTGEDLLQEWDRRCPGRDEVLAALRSSLSGLTNDEAEARRRRYGLNDLFPADPLSGIKKLFTILCNPFTLLLITLSLISFLLNDMRTTIVLVVMVLLSLSLQLFQEIRAEGKVRTLRDLVALTTRVNRNGTILEIKSTLLVPGDVVQISAGDLIPADLILISATDLYCNDAPISGEAIPREKTPVPVYGCCTENGQDDAVRSHICFLGSSVDSGSATGIVIRTGMQTEYGSVVKAARTVKVETEFDHGITRFTWLMIVMMLIAAPLIFVINSLTKGNIAEAILFSLALIVGITPEMLPLVMTMNLSKGTIEMAKKDVIVKRLGSIQGFGAMDLLCTDKTGTITEGKVSLTSYISPDGEEDPAILEYAALTSRFQTGLCNPIDEAVLRHPSVGHEIAHGTSYTKCGEIPFDFSRKRMSVIVSFHGGKTALLCKGSTDNVLPLCLDNGNLVRTGRGLLPRDSVDTRVSFLYREGFRVIAVAARDIGSKDRYSLLDEADLVLAGFLVFSDPPRDTTAKAIDELKAAGISVKILTGDHEDVTQSICRQVNLPVTGVLTGDDMNNMSDEELEQGIDSVTVFARLLPHQKERIVRSYKKRGHVVGFLGDGINDVSAMKSADIAISVNSAVDIAKEASDIVLLKRSLLVLSEGVTEGRKVFANILKYLRAQASVNVGYIFSNVGASLLFPFLPVLPIQILVNNLLFDISMTALPTDAVDKEYLEKPRRWDISGLSRFITLFGPFVSAFDYLTWGVLIFVFGAFADPALFQTGWFVQSVIIMILSIHVFRTDRIPFLQSRASLTFGLATGIVCLVGILLPYSPLAETLSLVPMPALFFVWLAGIFIGFVTVIQLVKMFYFGQIRLRGKRQRTNG